MPEFILDQGSPEAARAFNELDAFTQGYIEAMFFTSTGTGDDAESGLEHATVAELAPEALASIVADCTRFQGENAGLLAMAYEAIRAKAGKATAYEERQAGNDFWYTRNGHDVGFRDRGLGKPGEELTAVAQNWREVDLYRGDDGKLYLQ